MKKQTQKDDTFILGYILLYFTSCLAIIDYLIESNWFVIVILLVGLIISPIAMIVESRRKKQ